MMKNNEYIKYYVFSLTEYKMFKKLKQSIGKKYKPNQVLVNGTYKTYTQILNDPSESSFSDAIIIAYGDTRTMKTRVGEYI